MRKVLFILVTAVVVYSFLNSCSEDKLQMDSLDVELLALTSSTSPNGMSDYWKLADGSDLSDIPADPKNPLTREKIALGKFLFYEPGLGNYARQAESMRAYSCSSCHIPEAGFKAGRFQGIADGGFGFGTLGEGRRKMDSYEESDMDVQGIRPLSVVNVAYYATVNQWNGSFGAVGLNEGLDYLWEDVPELQPNKLGMHGLESQLLEGLNVHRMSMDNRIAKELGYKELFDAAFAEVPEEERYSGFNTAMAIAAYLRSLISDQAPFQMWLDGDYTAMTAAQKRGAILFFDKANCTSCHSSPALSAAEFYAVGVNDLDALPTFNEDAERYKKKSDGRGGFTKVASDYYKFKVPTLYNLYNSKFFFHGSSKTDLREVVEYFNEAIAENPRVPAENIASDFKPLFMTEDEIDDLTEFLRFGLYDANIMRHVPESLMSGNCFPNNDFVSRKEICGQE